MEKVFQGTVKHSPILCLGIISGENGRAVLHKALQVQPYI